MNYKRIAAAAAAIMMLTAVTSCGKDKGGEDANSLAVSQTTESKGTSAVVDEEETESTITTEKKPEKTASAAEKTEKATSAVTEKNNNEKNFKKDRDG